MENEGRLDKIEVLRGGAFFVWCYDCKKNLYDADQENIITLAVAKLTIDGHSLSFTPPHQVDIIRLNYNLPDD